MKGLDLSKIKNLKKLLGPLKSILKHHYFISTIAILSALIITVLLVNDTLQEPSDDTYRAEKASSGISSKFDEDTIEKIEKLQSSSETPSTDLSLPSGSRINPFSE